MSSDARQPQRPSDGERPGTERRVPDATSSTPDVEYRCDLCGAPMLEWHCRIICNFCGYQRDCSDP